DPGPRSGVFVVSQGVFSQGCTPSPCRKATTWEHGVMRIADSVIDLIGNTPLVKLNTVVKPGSGLVAAKIEYLNPGGSSKDRIAVKMIDAAEASGELKPGGTIVEPTSGNTGI